eukprot:gene2289-8577_t
MVGKTIKATPQMQAALEKRMKEQKSFLPTESGSSSEVSYMVAPPSNVTPHAEVNYDSEEDTIPINDPKDSGSAMSKLIMSKGLEMVSYDDYKGIMGIPYVQENHGEDARTIAQTVQKKLDEIEFYNANKDKNPSLKKPAQLTFLHIFMHFIAVYVAYVIEVKLVEAKDRLAVSHYLYKFFQASSDKDVMRLWKRPTKSWPTVFANGIDGKFMSYAEYKAQSQSTKAAKQSAADNLASVFGNLKV